MSKTFEIVISDLEDFANKYAELRNDIAQHYGLDAQRFRIKSGSCRMYVPIDGAWVNHSNPTLSEAQQRVRYSPIKLTFTTN